MVVAPLSLLLLGSQGPRVAKTRNLDTEVLRAAIAPFLVRSSKPNRKEVFVLEDEAQVQSRPEFFAALHEIDQIFADERGVAGPELTRQRLAHKRLREARRDVIPQKEFVPPSVVPLRTMDLGPRVVVGHLRSRGEMYGSSPLAGTKNVYAIGRGAASIPAYSPDGRYAVVRLTLVAGLHPWANYFLLRRETRGWTVIARAEINYC